MRVLAFTSITANGLCSENFDRSEKKNTLCETIEIYLNTSNTTGHCFLNT